VGGEELEARSSVTAAESCVDGKWIWGKWICGGREREAGSGAIGSGGNGSAAGWLVGLGFGRVRVTAGFIDAFLSVGSASRGRFRWVLMR
jgi:hypothetical protein